MVSLLGFEELGHIFKICFLYLVHFILVLSNHFHLASFFIKYWDLESIFYSLLMVSNQHLLIESILLLERASNNYLHSFDHSLEDFSLIGFILLIGLIFYILHEFWSLEGCGILTLICVSFFVLWERWGLTHKAWWSNLVCRQWWHIRCVVNWLSRLRLGGVWEINMHGIILRCLWFTVASGLRQIFSDSDTWEGYRLNFFYNSVSAYAALLFKESPHTCRLKKLVKGLFLSWVLVSLPYQISPLLYQLLLASRLRRKTNHLWTWSQISWHVTDSLHGGEALILRKDLLFEHLSSAQELSLFLW